VSPESLKLVGGWLASCTSMRALKPKPTNHRDPRKLKEAFLQGEEKEAANFFRQLLRQSVRAGLLEAMAEEVEALCGPRYRPDPQSPYHRAGSETGVAYLDGGREEILRPRVRHETDGEVRLATYEAASSSRNLFDQIVPSVAQAFQFVAWSGPPARQ
jgi:putative transposase